MEKNLYLITGNDIYERNRKLNDIKNNFGELVKGINYIVLDKDSIDSLTNEITTYAFGYSQKLIIVNISSNQDEGTNKNDWFTKDLTESILNSLESNVIVFIGDFQARSKIYKFVNENGKCIECNNPRSKKDIAPWVVSITRQYNKNISLDNANYMIQICSADKLMLFNEIQKMIDYIGDREEILKEDIDAIGIRTLETIIFDLTDCIGTRNISNTLQILEELLAQKEPLQKILIMVARHFKSLLITKKCVAENRNASEELNTKFPFIINKYKEQARRFELNELENILLNLADLDVDSKLGKIDLKIGLELALVKAV